MCSGSCVTNYDVENNITIISEGQHTHESDRSSVRVQEVLRGLKRRAEEHPNQPPSAVVRDELSAVSSEDVLMALPERNALLRTVNRHQTRHRPQTPTTLEDVEIRAPYDVTLRNDRFL